MTKHVNDVTFSCSISKRNITIKAGETLLLLFIPYFVIVLYEIPAINRETVTFQRLFQRTSFNKRILFLEYLIENEGSEILRITKGVNYIKHKEVYYQINLNEIENITNGKYYQVVLKNDMSFEFDDEELYNLLKI